MSNGLRTQGSELYFIDNSTTDGPEIVKLDCPSGLQGLGGARDQIEDTCLDNTDEKTFVAGLGNPGTMTAEVVFNPQADSHGRLFDLKNNGDVINWIIVLSDGTGAPTMDTDLEFVAPTARSSFKFSGFVSDVNVDIATNDIVKVTLSIQRSGAVIFTKKAD